MAELAATAGDEFLVGGYSMSRNRASSLIARLEVPPGHPRLSLPRLRSTWLLWHLNAGTRLPELAAAAGLQGVAMLSDLLGDVPPLPEGDARVMLRRSGGLVRAPLDTCGGRSTSGAELNLARQLIERSGIVEVLTPFIEADVGRPRQLSLLGFMAACQLNALNRHHQGHLVEVARTLNALTDVQRRQLGVTDWDPEESYPRVARLFTKLCGVLESGDAGVDATWFANQLARAAVPKEFLLSRSVAVDGTDIETWGALHGEAVTVAARRGGHRNPTWRRRRRQEVQEGTGAQGQGARGRFRWTQALHR